MLQKTFHVNDLILVLKIINNPLKIYKMKLTCSGLVVIIYKCIIALTLLCFFKLTICNINTSKSKLLTKIYQDIQQLPTNHPVSQLRPGLHFHFRHQINNGECLFCLKQRVVSKIHDSWVFDLFLSQCNPPSASGTCISSELSKNTRSAAVRA